MFLIPGSVRVFVAREPIDMRKSFEGLSNQVQHVLGRDPLSGEKWTPFFGPGAKVMFCSRKQEQAT